MPANTVGRGNEAFDTMIYLPSVAVPNVNANATATQTVTVAGVLPGDLIGWNQIGTITGIAVDNIYVSSANTLTFYWSNTTGSNVTGSASQPFVLTVARCEVVPYTAMPSGIY
jgi:hypothetical protein